MQKKKVFTLAVAGMVLLTMQAVPVSAASLEPSSPKPIALNRIITPQWVDTTLVVPSISKSKRSISVLFKNYLVGFWEILFIFYQSLLWDFSRPDKALSRIWAPKASKTP